ncbi:Protease 4, partial [Haemophilus influenzae]
RSHFAECETVSCRT